MRPNFKSGIQFDENLMGCEMGRIKVKMNKPVYLGQAILDLSKIITYEFHYDYMKPKFKDLQLCYMDTDSLGVFKKAALHQWLPIWPTIGLPFGEPLACLLAYP